MTRNPWPNKEEKAGNPASMKSLPQVMIFHPSLTAVHKRQKPKPDKGTALPWAHPLSHLKSVLSLEWTFLPVLLIRCVVSVFEFSLDKTKSLQRYVLDGLGGGLKARGLPSPPSRKIILYQWEMNIGNKKICLFLPLLYNIVLDDLVPKENSRGWVSQADKLERKEVKLFQRQNDWVWAKGTHTRSH